jgi:hypothetical protein
MAILDIIERESQSRSTALTVRIQNSRLIGKSHPNKNRRFIDTVMLIAVKC